MESRAFWLLVLLIPSQVFGANILVFVPFPSRSHEILIIPIMEELCRRGHSVVAFVSYPTGIQSKENYKEINLNIPHYEASGDFSFVQFGKLWETGQRLSLFKIGLQLTEEIFNRREVKDLLASEEKFDAVLSESFFYQEPVAYLAHKFNAVPLQVFSLSQSYWAYFVTGIPYNPAYIIDYSSLSTDHMTFWQRIDNFYLFIMITFLGYWYYLPSQQALADRVVLYRGWESRPSLLDTLSQTPLLFINSDPSLSYPYPLPPHVKPIAGVHITSPKPLPKDIEKIMNESSNGVIYFSLGSNLNPSDPNLIELKLNFAAASQELPYTVLWKIKEDIPSKSGNVHTFPWLPQQDILAHPNCKLFITHGGFLSLTESVYFGVPMIGIPFFGDQPKNMVHVKESGYGLELQFKNASKANFLWSINEVMTNPRYRDEVKRRSEQLRDQEMPPLERTVFWMEYLLRHRNASHFRPAVLHLAWYQALLLDVIAFALLIILASMFILRLLIVLTFRLLNKSNTRKKIKLF